MLVIQVPRRYTMAIIQVYELTICYTDEDVQDFYEEVALFNQNEKCYIKLTMEELLEWGTGLLELEKKASRVENHGYGKQNERVNRLVEFAECEYMCCVL